MAKITVTVTGLKAVEEKLKKVTEDDWQEVLRRVLEREPLPLCSCDPNSTGRAFDCPIHGNPLYNGSE